MIIQDIVWADLISWLHARGVSIAKVNGSYRVYLPEHVGENAKFRTQAHELGVDRVLWAEDGVSVTTVTLEQTFRVAFLVCVHVGGTNEG